MNFSNARLNFSNAPPTNLQYGPDTPALYAKLNEFERMKTRELTIMYLNIHSLPSLPDGLKRLFCYYNRLTSLPPLPEGLEMLDCGDNQLTSLPSLPDGLGVLFCYYNQLTSLPPLPEGLERLDCGNNQLTSLPSLPDRLNYLSCDNNQLTSLPPLPGGLGALFCNYNQLTSLPPLPGGLVYLKCEHNQLTSLPSLPDRLSNLSCDYNPNLVNITGECPPLLREEPASEVFKGCPNLVPQPNEDETLGAFFNRAAKAGKLPVPRELPVPEELIVPEGSENSIMMSEIQNGNILANFHNEKNFKRYYLKSTVNQLKTNPSTRKPIQPRNIKLYRARLNTRKLIGGKTRRNKKRKAKKTRKI